MAVVSIHPPFIILNANSNLYEMFGFDVSELIGESILRLVGPKSDGIQLQSAIAQAGCSESNTRHFVLYTNSGLDMNCMVSFDPCWRNECVVGCLINFWPSEAVTLMEALGQSKHPQILVSSESPYNIHIANEDFLSRFEFSRNQVLGKSLNSIIPEIDISEAWRTVLSSALKGSVVSWNFDNNSLSRAPVSAILFPVVDSPNGRIRNILIQFPAPQAGFGPSSPSSNTDDICCTPSTSVPSAAAASPECLKDQGHAIFPRRRGRSAGQPLQQPVVVTPESIRKLRGLPLQAAARALGVSATAFKRACRRLGLRRWTYKRGPAAEEKRALAASAQFGVGADGGDSDAESCGSPCDAEAGPVSGKSNHLSPRCVIELDLGNDMGDPKDHPDGGAENEPLPFQWWDSVPTPEAAADDSLVLNLLAERWVEG